MNKSVTLMRLFLVVMMFFMFPLAASAQIIEVDGYEVVNVEDLIQLLQDKKKDDILHCKVLSDGEMKRVDIKILT